MDLSFFSGKRILVTGNTGFKGTWLCKILLMAGAHVAGYSLEAPTSPSLYELTGIKNEMEINIGDIRDYEYLLHVFQKVEPEIVIHLAAQPIVRESYRDPRGTYDINVMGTVNICECVRNCDCTRSFLNVTTDKVYRNHEWEWGYRETDLLDGFDPYSNSKSCSDLVTHSYARSFFMDKKVAVSTARAGNVIGGGDFSVNRIIPDCVRAIKNEDAIIVRNPYSVRPYQHVLEPLCAYLTIVKAQYEDPALMGDYNVGPDDQDCLPTGELVDLFCESWKKRTHKTIEWKNQYDGGPHEAGFLKLDCSRIKSVFGWRPNWDIRTGMDKVIEWTDCYINGGNVVECMERQIKEFLSGKK